MLKIETDLIPMRGHEIHPSDFINVPCILALIDCQTFWLVWLSLIVRETLRPRAAMRMMGRQIQMAASLADQMKWDSMMARMMDVLIEMESN